MLLSLLLLLLLFFVVAVAGVSTCTYPKAEASQMTNIKPLTNCNSNNSNNSNQTTIATATMTITTAATNNNNNNNNNNNSNNNDSSNNNSSNNNSSTDDSHDTGHFVNICLLSFAIEQSLFVHTGHHRQVSNLNVHPTVAGAFHLFFNTLFHP